MNNKYSELFENMVRILDVAKEMGDIIAKVDENSVDKFEHDTLDVLIEQFDEMADQYESELAQFKNTVDLFHETFGKDFGNYLIQNLRGNLSNI